MKFQNGDRVQFKQDIETTRTQINKGVIGVIEEVNDQGTINIRYGKRKNQVVTMTNPDQYINHINTKTIGTMNEEDAVTYNNFNIGSEGILSGLKFKVMDVCISPNIHTDYFIVRLENGNERTLPAENLVHAENITKEPTNPGPQHMPSDEEFRELVGRIIGGKIPDGKEPITLSFPEMLRHLLEKEQSVEKEESRLTKAQAKSVKPIGHERKEMVEQTKENFEKQLIEINNRTGNKVLNIQIDGIEVELLENGEIKVPRITKKNISDVSKVLNKLDTILKFKGEI